MSSPSSVWSRFHSVKPRDKWVLKASAERILQDLTHKFINGDGTYGVGAALNSEERAVVVDDFSSISTSKNGSKPYRTDEALIDFLSSQSTGLSAHVTNAKSILSQVVFFFSMMPFEARHWSLLTHDALLRAAILLTGRDSKTLWVGEDISCPGMDTIILKRGKTSYDRVELLFRSLAAPKTRGTCRLEENKWLLDILAVVQPRPNPSRLSIPRDALKPMAERLEPVQPLLDDLYVRDLDLMSFMRAMGVPWNEKNSGNTTRITYTRFKEIEKSEPALMKNLEALFENFFRAHALP